MDKQKLRQRAEEIYKALFGEKLTCVCCGADLFTDGHFCENCLQSLPFNAGFVCSKCGRAIGADYPVCLECKADMPAYTEARSAFRYEGEIVRLVKQFKTGGRFLAAAFAERMAPLLLSEFSLQPGGTARKGAFGAHGRSRRIFPSDKDARNARAEAAFLPRAGKESAGQLSRCGAQKVQGNARRARGRRSDDGRHGERRRAAFARRGRGKGISFDGGERTVPRKKVKSR